MVRFGRYRRPYRKRRYTSSLYNPYFMHPMINTRSSDMWHGGNKTRLAASLAAVAADRARRGSAYGYMSQPGYYAPRIRVARARTGFTTPQRPRKVSRMNL